MAVCSFIFMPVVLLTSAVLLTGAQHTALHPSVSEPYVVAIHKKSKTLETTVCTGAFIKPKIILTTATCVDRAGSDILVSTAEFDSSQNTLVGKGVYEVLKFIKHPKSNSTIKKIDLAVIILKKEIKTITDLVSPLLVTNVDPMNGLSCTETHWLLQSPLTQLSRSGMPTPCADADTPSQVCVQFAENQACLNGSEGGVLACNGKVVGIFSEEMGNEECTPERVGFVNVMKNYDWINIPEMLVVQTVDASMREASSASLEGPLRLVFQVALAAAVSALFL